MPEKISFEGERSKMAVVCSEYKIDAVYRTLIDCCAVRFSHYIRFFPFIRVLYAVKLDRNNK